MSAQGDDATGAYQLPALLRERIHLTAEEVARLGGHSVRTSWHRAKDGTYPTVKCGRLTRFPVPGMLRAWGLASE